MPQLLGNAQVLVYFGDNKGVYYLKCKFSLLESTPTQPNQRHLAPFRQFNRSKTNFNAPPTAGGGGGGGGGEAGDIDRSGFKV